MNSNLSAPAGSSFILARTFLKHGLAFVLLGIVTRIYPSSLEVGQLLTIMMIGTVLSTMGGFWSRDSIAKLMSERLGQNFREEASAIQISSLQLGLFSSSLAGIASIVSIILIQPYISMDLPMETILALGVDTALRSLTPFFEGILRGLRNYLSLSILTGLISLFRQGSAIGFLLILGGISNVINGWAIGNTIGMFFLALVFSRKVLGAVNMTFPIKKLVAFSAPLFAIQAVNVATENLESFMALALLDVSDFGIYRLMLNITVISAAFWTALYAVSLPEAAYALGQNGMQGLREVTWQASRYIFIVLIPIATMIGVMSPLIISLFYGVTYVEYWWLLLMLQLIIAGLCHGAIVNAALIAIERQDILLLFSFLALVIALISGYFLISILGFLGTVFVKLVIYLVINLPSAWFLWKEHDILIDFGCYLKIMVASGLMLIPRFLIAATAATGVVFELFVFLSGSLLLVGGLKALRVANERDIQGISKIAPKRIRPAIRIALRHLLL